MYEYIRSPAVSGTSILGLKYDGGVMIAADTLGMLVISNAIANQTN